MKKERLCGKHEGLPYSLFLVFVFVFLCLMGSVECDPRNVYIFVYFNSVTKIDGVEQSFNADFYLTAFWQDNTVVNNVFDESINFVPFLEFANSRGTPDEQIEDPYSLATEEDMELLNLRFANPADGVWVKMDQRYIGNFNTDLDLKNFPFDKQEVKLQIESELHPIGDVVLLKGDQVSRMILPPNFEIIEWKILGTSANETSKYYKIFRQTYSRLEFKVSLKRQSEYYVWKIILGSVLLVIMSICTFVFDVNEPDRMMGAMTVFLALVSFLFVAGDSIPKVAYQTRLDLFFNFSFFTVFFIVLAHTINYLIMSKEIAKKKSKKRKRGESIQMMRTASSKDNNRSPDNLPTSPAPALGLFEEEEDDSAGQCIDAKSLSSKLDIAFTIIFSIVYTTGCLIILVSPVSTVIST